MMGNTYNKEDYIQVSIIELVVHSFICDITTEKEVLIQQMSALRCIENDRLRKHTITDILEYNQNKLVRDLHEFLDYCYLELVKEVIANTKPSRIHLRKVPVRLDPSSYYPHDMQSDDAEDTEHFFTLTGIISDMWNAFRFAPFETKMNTLTKSVEYTLNASWRREIYKHIEIRNCLQHQEGQIPASSLRRLGVNELLIVANPDPIVLKAWSNIILTKEELVNFCNTLCAFARDFGDHVNWFVEERSLVRRDLLSDCQELL